MEYFQRLVDVFSNMSKETWSRLIVMFMLYVIPIVIFVGIADEISEKEPLPGDTVILETVRHSQNQSFDQIIPLLTDLGGVAGVIVLMLIVVAMLAYKRYFRKASFVLIAVGGSAVLNLILKSLFQRDRPQLWERIVAENSFSFPSGHAMGSSALALSLMIAMWPTRYRWWAIIGGSTFMIVTAFTRLYLGVHYPSDIIAGWAASAVWVVAAWHIILGRQRSA